MRSLAEIRRNIKSIKSTQTITKTMKLVASARIKKAQKTILNGRPFADKLAETITTLQKDIKNDESFKSSWLYGFFNEKKQKNSIGVMIISSDRGLCGAFNTTLLKDVLDWLGQQSDKKIYAFIVGKKALAFLGKLNNPNIEIVHQTTGIFPKAGYANARIIGNEITDIYKNKNLSSFSVIYNEFTSLLTQTVKIKKFIPFIEFQNKEENEEKHSFTFEPEKKTLLEELVPRYINAAVYKILLESQAAELAARMNAMDAASKNAEDLMENLTVTLNKLRQEGITTEISEIVGAVEALK